MSKQFYMVFDTIEQKAVSFYDSVNVGVVIRNNYKVFEKINPYYKEDWKIYEVGFVDQSTGLPVFYATKDFKEKSWSEFNYPEVVGKSLSKDEAEDLRNQPTGVSGNPPPNL